MRLSPDNCRCVQTACVQTAGSTAQSAGGRRGKGPERQAEGRSSGVWRTSRAGRRQAACGQPTRAPSYWRPAEPLLNNRASHFALPLSYFLGHTGRREETICWSSLQAGRGHHPGCCWSSARGGDSPLWPLHVDGRFSDGGRRLRVCCGVEEGIELGPRAKTHIYGLRSGGVRCGMRCQAPPDRPVDHLRGCRQPSPEWPLTGSSYMACAGYLEPGIRVGIRWCPSYEGKDDRRQTGREWRRVA